MESNPKIRTPAADLFCPLCSLHFPCPESLICHRDELHYLSLAKTRPACKYCAKTFPDLSGLQIHYRDFHIKIATTCRYCGDNFTDGGNTQLLEHYQTNHPGKSLVCKICYTPHASISSLEEHVAARHSDLHWYCLECPSKFFKTRRSFFRHVREKHLDLAHLSYRCPFCELTLSDMRDLKHHIRQNHMKCEEVPSSTETLSKKPRVDMTSSDKDEKINTKSRQRNVLPENGISCCPLCKKTVLGAEYDGLSKHLESTHGSELFEIKECCPECAEFVPESELSSHILMQHPKLLQCNICPAANHDGSKVAFENLDQVLLHEKEEHEDYPYSCHFCGVDGSDGTGGGNSLVRLLDEVSFRNHCLANHPRKIYYCIKCPIDLDGTSPEGKFGYRFKRLLLSHLKSAHLGLNLRSCPFCDDQYDRDSLLIQHMELEHFASLPETEMEKVVASTPSTTLPVKKLQCPICNLESESESVGETERHVLAEHVDPLLELHLVCRECHVKCPNLALWDKHTALMHPASYTCKHCHLKFATSDAFNSHMETYHAETASICRYCSMDCQDVVKLSKHMNSHHPSYVYFCKTCDKMAKTKDLIRQHIKIAHFKILPFKCSGCLREFATNKSLQSHIVSKHDGIKLMLREQQGQSNSKNAEQTRSDPKDATVVADTGPPAHENDIIPPPLTTKDSMPAQFMADDSMRPEDRPVSQPCSKCGENFENEDKLKAHVVDMHSFDCVCPICGYKELNDPGEMSAHMSLHLDTATYTCHKCDDFDSDSVEELNAHMAETHFKIKEKQGMPGGDTIDGGYQCPHCPHVSPSGENQPSLFLTHIQAVHKDTFDDKEDEVLDIGNFTFKMITEEDHSIYFLCPICNHRAREVGNVKKHIRSVHVNSRKKNPAGLKHQCKLCRYGTNVFSMLTTHMKRSHPSHCYKI